MELNNNQQWIVYNAFKENCTNCLKLTNGICNGTLCSRFALINELKAELITKPQLIAEKESKLAELNNEYNAIADKIDKFTKERINITEQIHTARARQKEIMTELKKLDSVYDKKISDSDISIVNYKPAKQRKSKEYDKDFIRDVLNFRISRYKHELELLPERQLSGDSKAKFRYNYNLLINRYTNNLADLEAGKSIRFRANKYEIDAFSK